MSSWRSGTAKWLLQLRFLLDQLVGASAPAWASIWQNTLGKEVLEAGAAVSAGEPWAKQSELATQKLTLYKLELFCLHTLLLVLKWKGEKKKENSYATGDPSVFLSESL